MKSWMFGVLGAVAASVILLVISQFQAGSDALTEAQISAVIKKEMVVDINGETYTYGQALSKIDHNLTVVQEALADLSEE